MPKSIVVMTTVHTPFDNRIYEKQIKSLVEGGWTVTYFVSKPADISRSVCEIVHISPNRSRMLRIFMSTFQMLRAALKRRADLYHFHDPELIFTGLILKGIGRKVVYDVHENFPDDIRTKPYLPSWSRLILAYTVKFLEWLAGHALDGVITVTPTIANRFPLHKTVQIRNFPRELEFQVNEFNYCDRPVNLVYVGTIAFSRGILEILSLQDLTNKYPGLQIRIGGGFALPLEEQMVMRDLRSKPVYFLGQLTRPKVARLLSQAKIGLLLLEDSKGYRESYPVKLFEYMMAGIPVVASDFPIWRNLVGDFNCVIFVKPGDKKDLREAVEWLLDNPIEAKNMGERGRDAVLKNFIWEREAKRLFEFYEGILSVKR